MKNIYKCVYNNGNKEKKKLKIFDLNCFSVFSLEINDSKIVLKSNSIQVLNTKEFILSKIDNIELSMAVGGYSAAVTINMTVKYVYDIIIYIGDKNWILEFGNVNDFLNCIKKLKEKGLYIYDPIGIYKIISTMDQLEVEKYFVRNSKKLKQEFNIEQSRSQDRYVDK